MVKENFEGMDDCQFGVGWLLEPSITWSIGQKRSRSIGNGRQGCCDRELMTCLYDEVRENCLSALARLGFLIGSDSLSSEVRCHF
jgi:hypothetical protein